MTKCKSCGATVIWTVTERGSKMPVDALPVPNGKFELQTMPDGSKRALWIKGWDSPTQRFESHFATCPDALTHRKKR